MLMSFGHSRPLPAGHTLSCHTSWHGFQDCKFKGNNRILPAFESPPCIRAQPTTRHRVGSMEFSGRKDRMIHMKENHRIISGRKSSGVENGWVSQNMRKWAGDKKARTSRWQEKSARPRSSEQVWRWASDLVPLWEGTWAVRWLRRIQEDPALPVSAEESPRKGSHEEKLPWNNKCQTPGPLLRRPESRAPVGNYRGFINMAITERKIEGVHQVNLKASTTWNRQGLNRSTGPASGLPVKSTFPPTGEWKLEVTSSVWGSPKHSSSRI